MTANAASLPTIACRFFRQAKHAGATAPIFPAVRTEAEKGAAPSEPANLATRPLHKELDSVASCPEIRSRKRRRTRSTPQQSKSGADDACRATTRPPPRFSQAKQRTRREPRRADSSPNTPDETLLQQRSHRESR